MTFNYQLEMMRRAEEIRQGNAHVKENIEEQRQKSSKPKPASRKRRDAERAAARAQQQVRYTYLVLALFWHLVSCFLTTLAEM